MYVQTRLKGNARFNCQPTRQKRFLTPIPIGPGLSQAYRLTSVWSWHLPNRPIECLCLFQPVSSVRRVLGHTTPLTTPAGTLKRCMTNWSCRSFWRGKGSDGGRGSWPASRDLVMQWSVILIYILICSKKVSRSLTVNRWCLCWWLIARPIR